MKKIFVKELMNEKQWWRPTTYRIVALTFTILLSGGAIIVACLFSSPKTKPKEINSGVTNLPAKDELNIKQIDFKNYRYSLVGTGEEDFGKEIIPINGLFPDIETNPWLFGGVLDVNYGDLTSDGKEEAVVTLYFGSGVYYGCSYVIFIYTMTNGELTQIGILSPNKTDWDNRLKELGLMELIENGVKIKDGAISISRAAEGSHCCPSKAVTCKYKWNGYNFVLFKEPEIRPFSETDGRICTGER
jgi:hypothetical protein